MEMVDQENPLVKSARVAMADAASTIVQLSEDCQRLRARCSELSNVSARLRQQLQDEISNRKALDETRAILISQVAENEEDIIVESPQGEPVTLSHLRELRDLTPYGRAVDRILSRGRLPEDMCLYCQDRGETRCVRMLCGDHHDESYCGECRGVGDDAAGDRAYDDERGA